MFLYVYDKAEIEKFKSLGYKVLNDSNKDFTIFAFKNDIDFNIADFNGSVKVSNKLIF